MHMVGGGALPKILWVHGVSGSCHEAWSVPGCFLPQVPQGQSNFPKSEQGQCLTSLSYQWLKDGERDLIIVELLASPQSGLVRGRSTCLLFLGWYFLREFIRKGLIKKYLKCSQVLNIVEIYSIEMGSHSNNFFTSEKLERWMCKAGCQTCPHLSYAKVWSFWTVSTWWPSHPIQDVVWLVVLMYKGNCDALFFGLSWDLLSFCLSYCPTPCSPLSLSLIYNDHSRVGKI